MNIPEIEAALAAIHTPLTRLIMSGRIGGEDLNLLEDAEERINVLRNQLAQENESAFLTTTIR
jgi:hypothetical protein